MGKRMSFAVVAKATLLFSFLLHHLGKEAVIETAKLDFIHFRDFVARGKAIGLVVVGLRIHSCSPLCVLAQSVELGFFPGTVQTTSGSGSHKYENGGGFSSMSSYSCLRSLSGFFLAAVPPKLQLIVSWACLKNKRLTVKILLGLVLRSTLEDQ